MSLEDSGSPIGYRIEQAQNALDDAKYLLDGNRSPEGVINRSYYAMFYAVLALLEKAGISTSKHTGVISIFDMEFVLKKIFPEQLSKDLHKAFELRQRSDYKMINSISRDRLKQTWQKAANFVEAIKSYLLDII